MIKPEEISNQSKKTFIDLYKAGVASRPVIVLIGKKKIEVMLILELISDKELFVDVIVKEKDKIGSVQYKAIVEYANRWLKEKMAKDSE